MAVEYDYFVILSKMAYAANNFSKNYLILEDQSYNE